MKHMEILSLSGCWLPLAQSVAKQATPAEEEEARLMEEAVIERTLGAMVATVSIQPMVITWECLREEAQRDPEYKAMIEVVKNGGKGTWPTGTDGISKEKGQLSVSNGMVLFKGRSVVPRSIRRRFLDCLHSGHL